LGILFSEVLAFALVIGITWKKKLTMEWIHLRIYGEADGTNVNLVGVWVCKL